MKKSFTKSLSQTHPRTFARAFVSGFTLVELMVCVAIMMIISSVVIFNHKQFNDNLEITNLSYQVSLALRQAQVYGMSTKDFKGGTAQASRFNTPYGVHFDITASTGNTAQYIFFADANKNGIYDSTNDTPLETVAIGRGNKISKICTNSTSTSNPNDCTPSVMDITFKRPEPDPLFNGVSNLTSAVICLVSPQAKQKSIVIYSTGQISIVNGCV